MEKLVFVDTAAVLFCVQQGGVGGMKIGRIW